MDWSDTILFEDYKKANTPAKEDLVQVFPVQGVTLLQANVDSPEDAEYATDSLRGFRATRRVVLCNVTGLQNIFESVERQLGHALAREGQADLLISCGSAGREVAIGARDEGLSLSSVVVCSDDRSACEVLANQIAPGDSVLLLGVDDSVRARLVLSLEKRLATAPSFAKAA